MANSQILARMALASNYCLARLIEDGKYRALTEIAAAEGMDRGQASRIAQLARLAPAIVEACVTEPASGLTLENVLRRGVAAGRGEQRMTLNSPGS